VRADEEGHFAIVTSKPQDGAANGAPHLDVSVFARGLLTRLVTRMFFPDESAAMTRTRCSEPSLRPSGRRLSQ